MFRKIGLLLVCCLFMKPIFGQAVKNEEGRKPNNIQATPETVGAMVVGEKIDLMLKDGTYAKGKVHSTSNTEIQLLLTHVEPKGRLTGKQVSIPTKDISVIHYKKNGTVVVPIALGIVGFSLGMMAGLLPTWNEPTGNAGAVWGGAIAGVVAGGYGGKKLVERTITINVKSSELGAAQISAEFKEAPMRTWLAQQNIENGFPGKW